MRDLFLSILLVTTSAPPGVAQVALVQGTQSDPAKRAEGSTKSKYLHRSVERALQLSGLPFVNMKDDDVAAGKLSRVQVAVLPYNVRMPAPELQALERFVKRGGKLLVFFAPPNAVLDLLGATRERTDVRKWPAHFGPMAFRPSSPAWPERVRQKAEAVNVFRVSPKPTVAAVWDGTDLPALLLTPNGAICTIAESPKYCALAPHVLLAHDTVSKARMLAGIVGHYAPGLLQEGAVRAAELAGHVGPFRTLDPLAEAIDATAGGLDSKRLANARRFLATARKHSQAGRAHLAGKKHAEAHAQFMAARDAAREAYYCIVPSRDAEVRAIWWAGRGTYDWEEELRAAKEAGFNLILRSFPNPGAAYYERTVLGNQDAGAAAEADLRECVRWARRYGMEVHPWATPWRLWSKAMRRLAKDKRLIVDSKGEGYGLGGWLCPANPENQKLVVASAADLVKRVRLPGYHFDYIRYPNEKYCFCDVCRQRFAADMGLQVRRWPDDVRRGGPYEAAFNDWRREQINALVRRTRAELKSVRPRCVLSAAVFFDRWPNYKETIAQDPGRGPRRASSISCVP